MGIMAYTVGLLMGLGFRVPGLGFKGPCALFVVLGSLPSNKLQAAILKASTESFEPLDLYFKALRTL